MRKPKFFTPRVGLPQSSVLAPLIFIFYCSDMFNDCVSNSFTYADDATLVTAAETAVAANVTLPDDCNKNDAWLKKWRIKVSSSRTEILLLKPRQSDYIVRGLKYQGDEIRRSKSSKVLGITVDMNLKFRTHFQNATNHTYLEFTPSSNKAAANYHTNKCEALQNHR